MDYIEKMAAVDENSFKNPLDKQYIGDIKDLANTVIEIEDGLISKNSENDIDNMLEQGDNLIKIIDQSTNLVTVNNPVKYMFQQLKNTWNETAKEIKDAKLEKKNKRETLSEKFANAWAAINIQNEYYKDISKAVTYQNLMSDVNLYTNYIDKYSDFTKKAKKCLSDTIAKIDICADKTLDAITFGAYSKTAQWAEKKFYANYKSFDQSIEKSEMKSLADIIAHKFITNRVNTFERKYGHASSIEDMNKNIDNYYKNLTDNAFFWGNKTQIIENAPQYNGKVADVTFTDYKKSPVENAISFKEDIKKYFTNEVSKVCGTLDAVGNYIDNKYDATVEKIKQFGQKNKDKFNNILKNVENTFKSAKDAISWQYANIKMSKIKFQQDLIKKQIPAYEKMANRINQTVDGLIQKEIELKDTQKNITTLIGRLAGSISNNEISSEPSKQLSDAINILLTSLTKNNIKDIQQNIINLFDATKNFNIALKEVNYSNDIQNNPLLNTEELYLADEIKSELDKFIPNLINVAKDLTECKDKMNIIDTIMIDINAKLHDTTKTKDNISAIKEKTDNAVNDLNDIFVKDL